MNTPMPSPSEMMFWDRYAPKAPPRLWISDGFCDISSTLLFMALLWSSAPAVKNDIDATRR